MARLPVLTAEHRERLGELGAGWWAALTAVNRRLGADVALGLADMARAFDRIIAAARRTSRAARQAPFVSIAPPSGSYGIWQVAPATEWKRHATTLEAAQAQLRRYALYASAFPAFTPMRPLGGRFVAPFPNGVAGEGEWAGYA